LGKVPQDGMPCKCIEEGQTKIKEEKDKVMVESNLYSKWVIQSLL
jgi:hypothetical protein